VESYAPGPNYEDVRVVLEGDWSGERTVVFFDTYDGIPAGRVRTRGTENGLVVRLPDFRHDVALVVYPPGAEVPQVQEGGPNTPLHDRFERLLDRRREE
jgi:hypothetical protein